MFDLIVHDTATENLTKQIWTYLFFLQDKNLDKEFFVKLESKCQKRQEKNTCHSQIGRPLYLKDNVD